LRWGSGAISDNPDLSKAGKDPKRIKSLLRRLGTQEAGHGPRTIQARQKVRHDLPMNQWKTEGAGDRTHYKPIRSIEDAAAGVKTRPLGNAAGPSRRHRIEPDRIIG
jgi:hypothetical protein